MRASAPTNMTGANAEPNRGPATERPADSLQEERIVHARLRALEGNFICVYVVDPDTGRFREFSATDDHVERFALAKEGTDFFGTVREVAQLYNHPEDLDLFLLAFTKENVLAEIGSSGVFTLGYRLLMDGKPLHVQMKAAMVEEEGSARLIVGLIDIDAQVRREKEYGKKLEQARGKARIDALTGIKNKRAYLEVVEHMNQCIEAGTQQPFAIVICDVSDLKTVSDTFGRQAGDQLIRDACKTICAVFKHSPVFRIGEDEFAVISQGADYVLIEELLRMVEGHNAGVSGATGIAIACGIARFDDDACVDAVFERADQDMHENKRTLEPARNGSPEVTETPDYALLEWTEARINQYDSLTGLQTMTRFFEMAETRKEAIHDKGGQPALVYIDFGGMKFFNSKHGFTEGDKILRSFAGLLVRAFGIENCCRIGADHFAAIADETGLEDELGDIFHEFGGFYGGKTPPVHAGIYPYHVEDVHTSTACDRAKYASSLLHGSFSSCFGYYNTELREAAVMRRYIIENLDNAISGKWIQVYYQPIIRSVSERVCDVEALARWVDPEKGVLAPDSFIPALEGAGLIYKLDLYMVEQVLESIKTRAADGFHIVPHSINLSRSDFDACDIVEEIRKRVDAAGVERDRITIEITESVVGKDLDFMKEQVERFQDLGFPVWMDDFGSGYSSLDALQSIRFDLIKFDMGFMRKLDEGEGGKVILTELMRMATSLGVGTACEGVETESQVRFLQEIGCSKLQGFYYSKPMPYETLRQMRGSNALIEDENPEESDYYESMSKVNLYDLGVIAQGDEGSIQNAFDMLPIGLVEIKGDATRFVRSNQSYRNFIKRFFGFELSKLGPAFVKYDAAFMRNVVKTCCEQGLRSFYDEKMADGSIVHSFARHISTNPVSGEMAVVLAVLSVSDSDEATSYADIARALAADYYNIYVVDLDTNNYVEYSSLVGGEELALERHGTEFFESAKRDTMTRIHEDDRAAFLARFSKDNVIRDLDAQGAFRATYRLIDGGSPFYVNMKITRMQGGNRIILGVSKIEATEL